MDESHWMGGCNNVTQCLSPGLTQLGLRDVCNISSHSVRIGHNPCGLSSSYMCSLQLAGICGTSGEKGIYKCGESICEPLPN